MAIIQHNTLFLAIDGFWKINLDRGHEVGRHWKLPIFIRALVNTWF
jgi:hypothetical protein